MFLISCTKIEINMNPKNCNVIKIISQLARDEIEYCFMLLPQGSAALAGKKEASSVPC